MKQTFQLIDVRGILSEFSISRITLWRWLNGPVQFPQPIRVGGKRLWRFDDVNAFVSRRAARNVEG